MIHVLRLIKKIILFVVVSHLAYVILLRFVDPPITITQVGSLFSGNGFKRTHVSLEEMSTASKLAVLAAEDQLFPDHNGFDIKGIKRALDYNKRKKGKKIRGHPPSANRWPKMFSYGREEAGSEKGWRCISPS